MCLCCGRSRDRGCDHGEHQRLSAESVCFHLGLVREGELQLVGLEPDADLILGRAGEQRIEVLGTPRHLERGDVAVVAELDDEVAATFLAGSLDVGSVEHRLHHPLVDRGTLEVRAVHCGGHTSPFSRVEMLCNRSYKYMDARSGRDL